jgi:hypothetical protein
MIHLIGSWIPLDDNLAAGIMLPPAAGMGPAPRCQMRYATNEKSAPSQTFESGNRTSRSNAKHAWKARVCAPVGTGSEDRQTREDRADRRRWPWRRHSEPAQGGVLKPGRLALAGGFCRGSCRGPRQGPRQATRQKADRPATKRKIVAKIGKERARPTPRPGACRRCRGDRRQPHERATDLVRAG